MQRHFSHRGEAPAKVAAAKVEGIAPGKTGAQAGTRDFSRPWPQQVPTGDESESTGSRTIAKVAAGGAKTHTFQVRGQTLPDLLEKAARALVELDGQPPGSEWFTRRTVEVNGSDRDSLVANWLNEVVLREQTLHELYDQFVVKEICGNHLLAQLYGRKSKKHITPIKKVILQRLTEHPNGLEATFVADVRRRG